MLHCSYTIQTDESFDTFKSDIMEAFGVSELNPNYLQVYETSNHQFIIDCNISLNELQWILPPNYEIKD